MAMKFNDTEKWYAAIINSRSDDHHVAISHCAHTNQEVRERHTEFEPANGTLVVVVTIEED